MKIVAFNSSMLGVTSMIGNSIQIDDINIIVGSATYDASGIKDDNNNGLWDPGETIFIYGVDLTKQTSVVVATDTTVLMHGTVQWSYSPTPAGTPGGSTYTSYVPGMRMTTYSDPAFMSPVSAHVADNITYASAGSGYWTNDPAWPQSEAGRAHNFSVKFGGYLLVDNNETYDICIMATDSMYISVDGTRIVDVTGSHGPSGWTATTYLTAGYHAMEIGYRNYDNDAMIGELYIKKQSEATWTPPGLYYQESTNA